MMGTRAAYSLPGASVFPVAILVPFQGEATYSHVVEVMGRAAPCISRNTPASAMLGRPTEAETFNDAFLSTGPLNGP
jgi:hypothetical protein